MQARRHALQEADALLRELDVPQDAPVDVFALIEKLDLELVFNNLRTILGALVPHGDGGIMLSTQRGAAVQRYTAAHEIGHWVLDHEAAFDTEADLYYPTHDREQLAQIFASQLLMPPPLVYATAGRYGVTNSPTATGPSVYSMARDMGASYEAVVRQLDNLDLISRNKRDELLAIQPAIIKAQLALGHRPAGNVDVWPVDDRSSGGAIAVTEGDEVIVMLPENRTTGYKWLTEDDLQARARRRVHPAPPTESGAQAPGPELGWAPPATLAARPRQDVDRALLAIRGNAGSTRILPGAEPTGEETDELGREGDETLDLQAGPRLRPVEDVYRSSWTAARPSELRALRRSIARGEPLQAAIDRPPAPAHGAVDSTAPSAADLLVGGTGTRVLALRSSGEGRDTFRLVYSSAYDPSAASTESYEIDVTIARAPSTARRQHHLSVAAEPRGDDEPTEAQGHDQGGPDGVDGD
ncbi:ImmA/IrrE family metallo-endopeptidase [Janibacter massiliensis]|uniref:ImmA/IrrE family metallo-endopeptidase n=1 Tax=Janibacter massiliensis TaxID=2058291 RepID=UPI001F475434|nr:ImmA/IrrE family metallo-endopeptidase [Janibacter massiliensis]